MGQWRIVIEGVGPHHGSEASKHQHPDDAEKLGVEFVRELQRHGQRIERAQFERVIPDPRVESLSPRDGHDMTRMDAGVSARHERATTGTGETTPNARLRG